MRFRPDTQVKDEYGPSGLTKGHAGATPLAQGEARVSCPKCGSPAVVEFDEDDEKYGAEIPGFQCEAGDCHYEGVAIRRAA